MKNLMKIGLLAAMLSMPVYAYAQNNTMPQKEAMMQCPMAEDMTSLQKDMGGMMGDMDSMMGSMSDPAMKERMQAMHDHMAAMMAHMQKMHGMMGSGMMDEMMNKGMMGQGSKIDGKGASDVPAAATSEDHEAHHPDKQQ